MESVISVVCNYHQVPTHITQKAVADTSSVTTITIINVPITIRISSSKLSS